MSAELTVTRTPEAIASEINGIKNVAKAVFLASSVEIGRCLVEAKSQLAHGEWGKWLEKSVDYSQSTANNLMKLYNEYGDSAKIQESQAFGNLSYTKAMTLLGVPAEDREQFVADHDVEGMSSRELQKAVSDLKEAEERVKAAEETAEREREARSKVEAEAEKERQAREALERKHQQERDARKQLEEQSQERATEVEQLKEQLSAAVDSGDTEAVQQLETALGEKETKLTEFAEQLDASKAEIKRLEKELKKKPIETTVVEVEKIPSVVETELAELRAKVAKHSEDETIIKFKVCFNGVTDKFKDLLSALNAVPEAERANLKRKIFGMIGKMNEALK
ncbi:DUF3102 domain-containing protein [Tumebacillus permanentifrigoris]|uniref:DUF3102 family protein n=1 Tax=Tumebacillus permanentifrigoris TaxID=378543 RepID=A0A316D4A6_9BACL|nr:DUF3102 domain-containing protein [Tumebacillus permanentifrigoris]PWK05262.1 hypothetical protein C7459_12411 [Tumebacillus permanentifrigoris]